MSSSQICIANSDILPLPDSGPLSDMLKPILIGSAALAGAPPIPCFRPPAFCRPTNPLNDPSSFAGNDRSISSASRWSPRSRTRRVLTGSSPMSGTPAETPPAICPRPPFDCPQSDNIRCKLGANGGAQVPPRPSLRPGDIAGPVGHPAPSSLSPILQLPAQASPVLGLLGLSSYGT